MRIGSPGISAILRRGDASDWQQEPIHGMKLSFRCAQELILQFPFTAARHFPKAGAKLFVVVFTV